VASFAVVVQFHLNPSSFLLLVLDNKRCSNYSINSSTQHCARLVNEHDDRPLEACTCPKQQHLTIDTRKERTIKEPMIIAATTGHLQYAFDMHESQDEKLDLTSLKVVCISLSAIAA